MNNYESIMKTFSAIINSVPSWSAFIDAEINKTAEEIEQAEEEEFEKTNSEYFTDK